MQSKLLSMNRHPKVLYFCLFFDFVIHITAWGLISIFMLYGLQHMSADFTKIYLMQGTFTALSFAFTCVGGWMADRLLGFKQALRIGFLLLTVGALALKVIGFAHATVGFSLMAFGLGLTMSNNPSYLGTFYPEENTLKTNGFTLLYAARNAGALTGPVIYGYLSRYFSWDVLFLINAGLLIFAYLSLYVFKDILLEGGVTKVVAATAKSQKSWGYGLLSIILLGISLQLFNRPSNTLWFLLIIFALTIFYLYKNVKPFVKSSELGKLLLMMLFCLAFFVGEFQINNSMVMFISDHVNRHMLFTVLPASTVMSFEPFFVVILAPIVNMVARFLFVGSAMKSTFSKITAGFVLEGAAFFVIYHATLLARSNHLVPLDWIVLAYLLLGLGELLLMPSIISRMAHAIPYQFKGLGMGSLYLTVGFSGYLSAAIASFAMKNLSFNLSLSGYSALYWDLACAAALCALIGVIIRWFPWKINFSTQF